MRLSELGDCFMWESGDKTDYYEEYVLFRGNTLSYLEFEPEFFEDCVVLTTDEANFLKKRILDVIKNRGSLNLTEEENEMLSAIESRIDENEEKSKPKVKKKA